MFRACEGFGWPREATAAERSDTSSSDSRPEADPTRYKKNKMSFM